MILDEVDQLQETRALYDLYSIPQITMVLIANRETELFADLDDRLRSRLQSSVRVRFDAYASEALVAICFDRVRWGLSDDAIGTGVLERIADIVFYRDRAVRAAASVLAPFGWRRDRIERYLASTDWTRLGAF